MKRILVPCDGSENAVRAARYAASLARACAGVSIDLLFVHDPISLRTHAYYSKEELDRMQANESGKALEVAQKALEESSVSWAAFDRAGAPANQIAQHVREKKCDLVVMGTRGLGPAAGLVMGSVATQVVHLADVPVTLVK
jgi:nucleotide-binding universal stress UspA family protein